MQAGIEAAMAAIQGMAVAGAEAGTEPRVSQ